MSDNTFARLRASLPMEVAARYDYQEKPGDRLQERLDKARSQGDWKAVAQVAVELEGLRQQAG